jgi:hypothetical protein
MIMYTQISKLEGRRPIAGAQLLQVLQQLASSRERFLDCLLGIIVSMVWIVGVWRSETKRSLVLGIFYLAIPVGSGLGFVHTSYHRPNNYFIKTPNPYCRLYWC